MIYIKRLSCILLVLFCIFAITAALEHNESGNTVAPAEELVNTQPEGISAGRQQHRLFDDVPRTSPFPLEKFERLILKMHVSIFNNPSYWFEPGEWRRESDNCQIFGGEDEIVAPYQFNIIKRVHYYRYKNSHPLDPAYYMQDAETVRFLNRFCFYRFTGKTLIPAVDVYLFALDMYTGLIFSYALPSRFEKVLGHRIPRDWVPLEAHPYVLEHFPGKKFYEFDPVGIVQADGKILLYNWIIRQNKRKAGDILNYIPHMDNYKKPASAAEPGYSPYRVKPPIP